MTTLLGAIVLGDTEAVLIVAIGAALFTLLGWIIARWQISRHGPP